METKKTQNMQKKEREHKKSATKDRHNKNSTEILQTTLEVIPHRTAAAEKKDSYSCAKFIGP